LWRTARGTEKLDAASAGGQAGGTEIVEQLSAETVRKNLKKIKPWTTSIIASRSTNAESSSIAWRRCLPHAGKNAPTTGFPVRMDGTSKQLTGEIVTPVPGRPGIHDSRYFGDGVAGLFVFHAPPGIGGA